MYKVCTVAVGAFRITYVWPSEASCISHDTSLQCHCEMSAAGKIREMMRSAMDNVIYVTSRLLAVSLQPRRRRLQLSAAAVTVHSVAV